MNATSLPLPDSAGLNGRSVRLPEDQPMPTKRVKYRESVVWPGASPPLASAEQERSCAHWPLEGAAQIQAAAQFLQVLAEIWTPDGFLAMPRHAGCIDLDLLASETPSAALAQRLASFPAQMQAQKLALRALADDFAKISAWLAKAAGYSWDAAKDVRQKLGLAAALGESHRVIAKDWLAADMNALIATLLRRAVGVLDRVDLAPGAINTDLAGQRAFGPFIRLASDMLERAAALAREAALFVDEFDRRWHQFRQQAAVAVAVSPNPVR